jgi:uncharacterized protein (DUF1697 family)
MAAALQIALLRGINVGGNKMVSMADLRDLFTRLGFSDVKTLLQSGNVVFAGRQSPAKIEKMIEAEVDAVCFVRTAKEWAELVERNPFKAEAKNDPSHFVAMVLKDAPKDVEPLRRAIVGREKVHLDGKVLYAVYPDGQGTSKLTNAVIEKHLGTRGTARNWNTVLKLLAAVSA